MKSGKPPDFKFKSPTPEAIRALQVIYHKCKKDKLGREDGFVYEYELQQEWSQKIQEIVTLSCRNITDQVTYNKIADEIETTHKYDRVI